ncbi:MAG: hypothetical protein NTU74_09175 [Deltaproteobacteria bacterium]|nr:hypothetical protein [Deltaproteobacteria bacterium]
MGRWDAVVSLVRQTAYREGFGNTLAEGSLRLASQYGHQELTWYPKARISPAMIQEAYREWG